MDPGLEIVPIKPLYLSQASLPFKSTSTTVDDAAHEGIYLKIRAIQNQLMILAGKSCFLSPLKAKPGFFKIMNYGLKNGLHLMLAHGSTDER